MVEKDGRGDFSEFRVGCLSERERKLKPAGGAAELGRCSEDCVSCSQPALSQQCPGSSSSLSSFQKEKGILLGSVDFMFLLAYSVILWALPLLSWWFCCLQKTAQHVRD